MKVTFVAIGTEQLGLSHLSALVKAQGHEVNVAFAAMLFNDRYNLEFPLIAKYFDDTQNVIDTIRRTQPDVVAFSPLTGSYKWMLEIAEHVKSINHTIKIVFGGVHASAVPDRVIANDLVDFVVVGEGDVAFPAILKAIEKEDYSTPIPNTRFKNRQSEVVKGMQKAFIQDLDAMPFYDKLIWEDYVRIGDLYLTMASRGCPYRCTFCFNNFFAKLPEEKSGKYVRMRSPDHMLAELKFAKKRYKLDVVDFQDDVFTTSKVWLQEFLPKYKKEINKPFQILTHPRFMDDEIAKLLSNAGCEWIQMGVQSMDEGFKKETLLRYEKSDDVNEALEVMHKYKMKVKVDHMFGLPDEPIAAQNTALDLYIKQKPDRVQTFWTTFLPGTEMMNEAIRTGLLKQEDAEKIYDGEDFLFFRNYDSIKDPKTMKKYQAYEVIFRGIPIMPNFIRKNLKPEHIMYIPTFVYRPLSMFMDIAAGLGFRNPEFKAYLYHNIFHIYRYILMRFGINVGKANKISDDEPYLADKNKITDSKDSSFISNSQTFTQ